MGDTVTTTHTDAGWVRQLADAGVLARQYEAASTGEQRRLRVGVYEIVWPVVFFNLTRRIEHARGHTACATSVTRLEPECLDRFQDDVEAVVDDLCRHGTVRIPNLEGWLTSRLTAATVDAHRRRRAARGALQRVRLPQWLSRDLDADPWLTSLAMDILTWVGVANTAGTGIWPLHVWTERRAQMTGNPQSDVRDTAADVERVLAVMRRRPRWYADFVERPLGRKQVPVVPPLPVADQHPRPLLLAERHEIDDALLRGLAAEAIDAITQRIQAGAPPREAVIEIVNILFGSGTDAYHLDRPPGSETDDERVLTLINDPKVIDRIVATIPDIIGE